MKKLGILMTVVLVLAVAGYWLVMIPETAEARGEHSRLRLAAGPYPVLEEAFEAVDTTRKTQANNEFAGSDTRVLKGLLWRPQHPQGPGPLLVYSHGFMSFHLEGRYLAHFLASHGYTVVAVDYPLTNFFAPGKPLVSDVVNQPGDVSFLITTLLERNRNSADVLHNTLDPKRIAVAGVSLGGLTSTLVTYHRQVRDPRIAAAVSIAGPAAMFTADFFAGSSVPFLMLAGSGDAMVVPELHAVSIPQRYPGSWLVMLRDASHTGFAQAASTFLRFFRSPDALGCRALRKGLKNRGPQQVGLQHPAEENRTYMPGLDRIEDGVDMRQRPEPCTSAPIPVAMNAARQQMYTTLVVHSFLESVWAADPAVREAARQFLQRELPAESGGEVQVSGG